MTENKEVVESVNEPSKKDKKKKLPIGARITTAVCSIVAFIVTIIGGILGGA